MVRQSLGPLRQAELFAEIEHDPVALRTLGEKKVAALARKKRLAAEETVAGHHARADRLADYARDQHRQDRPAYQWIEEHMGIQIVPI
jgi:hypothetical protein